jgi:hypothetical protein
MSALDRTEIHAFIERRWREPRPGDVSLAGAFSDCIGEAAQATDGLYVIDDFRPSELDGFEAARSLACQTVQRVAEAMLLQALTDALVGFAVEHPAAPRG